MRRVEPDRDESRRKLWRAENSLFLENGDDLQHEDRYIVLKACNLITEGQRITLVEAMVLDRVIPRFDSNANRLEAAHSSALPRPIEKLEATSINLPC